MRTFLMIVGVVVLVGGVLAGVTFFILLMNNPHMEVQPHIPAFERPMPLAPPGMMTTEPDARILPTAEQATRMKNPIADTPANLTQGKAYYGYYCVFCHGDSGRGDGPVGDSYMPRPADLTDPKILKKSDGQLLRAMLLGVGHEPVLASVVPAEFRWHLVLYTKALARGLAGAPEPEVPYAR